MNLNDISLGSTQIAISSPGTLEILFQALIESGIRPSNIEDRSPEAFAALIRQKSRHGKKNGCFHPNSIGCKCVSISLYVSILHTCRAC